MIEEELTIGEKVYPTDAPNATTVYPTDIPEVMPYTPEEQEDLTTKQAYLNVFNPWFGVKYGTGLSSVNPSEKSWEPENTEWVNKLDPDARVAISSANSEEYAIEILKRRDLYKQSQQSIADDSIYFKAPAALAAAVADPTVLLPVGWGATATKAAYTLGAKSSKLAMISAQSAGVSMIGATTSLAAERGAGYGEGDYVTTNTFAALIGGGLPIVGNMLGGGYSTYQTAKYLSDDNKQLLQVAGALTAEKLGGTQATTFWNKWAPTWMQSDVMITSGSNNPNITLVSNRIDAPTVAVVDKATGQYTPIGKTGFDYKDQLLKGVKNGWKSKLNSIRNESTITNETQFNIEVGKTIRERANRQEIEVYTRLNDEMTIREAQIREEYAQAKVDIPPDTPQEAIDDLLKANENKIRNKLAKEASKRKRELYDEVQLEFKHSDPKIVEASKLTDDLVYKRMLNEGHKLKSKEMLNISANRHYMTRIYDFQAIRSKDRAELQNTLYNALVAHPANKGTFTDEELAKQAMEITNKMKSLDFDKEFADYSFMVPKEAGLVGFLKSRQYKFDERVLGDLLTSNIDDVVGQYMYKQSGHYGALHAFPEMAEVPLKDQLEVFREKYITPMQMSGLDSRTGKELEGLENMFSDLLGTFRIPKNGHAASWKAARIGNAINSLTYGGAFALNTAAETGALMMSGPLKNVFKTKLSSLKEIGHLFNGKTIDDPLVNDMILAGNLEQLFEFKGMMRMADTEGVFDASKLENSLEDMNNVLYKYNGLRAATTALEIMAGTKIVHDVMDLGAKTALKEADVKYLARIGLSQEDAASIGTLMKKHGSFNKEGRIHDLKMTKWDNDEAADKLFTAMTRGVKQYVIKGDSTYVPSWLVNPNTPMAPFTRMVTNFLRYPLAATETLLVRGMDEDMAKWVTGTMTSVFMMSSVLYLREKAAVEAGLMEEHEAKFQNFWEDEDASVKLFAAAFSKAGTLGGSTIMLERLSAISGVPLPGNEYAQDDVLKAVMGPTFSRIPQLTDILTPMLTEGIINSKQQWYALKSMMPGATFPFINEYLTTQIKENTY